MAQFTITINEQLNNPPNQIGNKNIIKQFGVNHIFTLNDFKNTIPPYQDPEGDEVSLVKIVTIPLEGMLQLSGVNVIANQEITKSEIDSGNLVYLVNATITDGYADRNLTFDLADEGSGVFSGLTPGNIGLFMVKQTNNPPSEIGDNSLTTNFGQSIVFTVDDFTTNTTPAYSDPEGDSAECLQILSLPLQGTLQLNSVDVVLNQEILFTDIALGLFTFLPNNSNKGTYDVSFEFQIKDSGSGEYTV